MKAGQDVTLKGVAPGVCPVCSENHMTDLCPYKDPESHWQAKQGAVNHAGNPAFWLHKTNMEHITLLENWRAACAALGAWRKQHIVCGDTIKIESARFKGEAMVMPMSDSCPMDSVPVVVGGNSIQWFLLSEIKIVSHQLATEAKG